MAADVNDDRWERLAALFDRMLSSTNPESTLASEPDPEIRSAAAELWRHHVSASAEDFLSSGLDFTVAPVFHPGQVLSNRFRIERLLGRGGMGEVYLALDERIGDRVALKTIARLLAESADLRRRIVSEVQNARRVTHPNVCRIHELFEDGETVFFTMEYLEGRTLAEVLDAPIARPLARTIMRQLAEGLHAAHRIGVVHGDFNPSNVMVVPGVPPRAVIMDFGLARAADRSAPVGERALSLHGGTAGYTAPELLEGAKPDVRSDVYSFGKVGATLLPGWKIWSECSEPDPEARHATLEPALRRLTPGATRRYWMAAGVCAAAAAAYGLGSRNGFRIPAGARLLVNGFRAAADPPRGARAARGLLVTALTQSPKLHLVPDQDLLPALKSLGATLPLAGPVLLTLLARLRAGFWTDARLQSNGSRCSLTLQLFRAADRAGVATVSLRDYPSVASAVQAAALWLRSVAGESARSLAAEPATVESYTSHVPEALEKYYEALERIAVGNMQDATPLLEEAVQLDPDFAQAQSTLGMALNPQLRLAEAYEHVAAAWSRVDRLPPRERVRIESDYSKLTDDPDGMVDAARRNHDYYPDEPRTSRGLAWALARSGLPEEAVEYSRKAVEMAPDNDLYRAELVTHLVESGSFDAALQEYEVALRAGARNNWIFGAGALANLGVGRYQDARDLYAKEPLSPSPVFRTCDIARAQILAGDVEAAISDLEQLRSGVARPAERYLAGESLVPSYFLVDRVDLARRAMSLMAEIPAYPQFARLLQSTAFWAGRVADPATLAGVRERASAIVRQWPNRLTKAVAFHADALDLRQRGDTAGARDLLLQSLGSAASVWALFDLADIYSTLGLPDVALPRWREFERARGIVLSRWCPAVLLLGWLHSAMAARAAGESAAAREYAQRVLEHWSRRHSNLRIVQLARKLNS